MQHEIKCEEREVSQPRLVQMLEGLGVRNLQAVLVGAACQAPGPASKR